MLRRLLTLGLGICSVIASSAVLAPSLHAVEAIAVQGDVALGSGGPTMQDFWEPIVDRATGDIVFTSQLSGASSGVFLHSESDVTPVVVVGDPGPLPSSFYADVGGARFSALGDPVFRADLGGIAIADGWVIQSGGVDSLFLRLGGDPVPGLPGAFIIGVRDFSMNAFEEIAFFADYHLGPTHTKGLFKLVDGVVSPLVLSGDPAPETDGGVLFFPGSDLHAVIDPAGDVWFRASVGGGSVSSGLFHTDGTIVSAVVLPGDAAPDTGGAFGSFFELNGAGNGHLTFRANVDGSAAAQGLFTIEAGAIHAIVLQGDPAIGTGGGTFDSFGGPFVNASGELAFAATLSGGTTTTGVFATLAGKPYAVALVGDSAPRPAGATFTWLSWVGGIDASGRTAFVGGLSGGAPHVGVYAPEPGAAPLMASGVAMLVWLARRRQRPVEPGESPRGSGSKPIASARARTKRPSFFDSTPGRVSRIASTRSLAR